MAQYTKSQLVSASNATYFTNTSGGISASAVRDLNDSWISSSALLSGSNTFIGNQIISGTLTAQLPANYIWLGDSNGYNQAVATSSISLQGAQGIQGIQGTQGTQGIQGITGLQGLQGLQGIQGLQGTQGIQGITGLQGIQGIEGASGSQGIQGLQGLQGIQGADNSTQGTQGIQGLQGLQGIQGITGISGSNGAQGIQGIQGIQGADNSTQGTQGIQGITGLQGITGISGSNGAQGTQGIQGVQGTDNSTQGAQGAQGIAGSAGSGSADTGSLLVTASFASNNITFTKGDASQFSLAGFATTGSNTFIGNQKLDGKLTISGSDSNQIFFERQGGGDILRLGVSQNGNTFELGLTGSVNKTMWLIDNQGGTRINTFAAPIIGTDWLIVQGALTASLQQGYAWVGNSSNVSSLVATSSFGGTTNTGSLMLTGSIAGNILTFTKGDASTFSLTIPSATGSVFDTGSFATTGSNTFYGNQTISNADLFITNTGSAFIQMYSQTQNNLLFNSPNTVVSAYGNFNFNNNGGAGGSGSLVFTATNNSVQITGSNGTIIQGFTYPTIDGTNGQVLTTNGSKILSFTTVSGSGGSIDTGSFLTTGSLAFGGSTNKGNGVYQFNIATGSAGYAIEIFNTGSDALYGGTGSMRFGITDPGNPFIQLKGQPWFQFGTGNQLQFQSFTSSYDNGIIIGPYYTASEKVRLMPRSSSLQFSQDIGAGEVPIFTLGTKDFSNPSQSIFETDLRVKGQFTASLQQGYAWVGNASGISTLVATSSFGGGSSDTGSLLVTASFNTTTRNITFTKGDATTFNLGGFATTGSNTFTGNQTISTTGNSSLTISSSAGGQSNINLQNSQQNITAYGQLIIGNNGGSGSIRVVANSNQIDLAADSGVAIGPVNTSGFAVATGAIRLLAHSGSLILSNNSFTNTTASLSHLSSSFNTTLTNFIFKANNNTGTTIISGSGNIFTNPATPTTGYIRYIGGANNIYLNSSNGVTSQITASAISVSGVRPTMNNNIFQGTADFVINQAVNGGTHTYSGNLFGSANAVTINALAYTGSSFSVSDNIFKGGVVTINPASASLAEIAAGISGSANVEFLRNIVGGLGTVNINVGPRMGTAFNSFNGNIVFGTLNVTNISSSAAVGASSNIGNGTMAYSNAGAAGLALHRNAGIMSSNYGSMNLIASASAMTAQNNIANGTNIQITNQTWSGSIGSGSLAINRCIFQGQSHTIIATGSQDAGTTSNANMSDNTILGRGNTIYLNQTGQGAYNAFNGNVVGGQNLIVSASNSFTLSEGGGAHFGRYNADDGRRNKTGENIFSVGTGVSGSRKTGFLIDSGSNSYFEGTLNVSGSTAMTGSLVVSSFTTLASVSSSLNFADDTAAAAGGVPLGGLYRNGNFVMIRLT